MMTVAPILAPRDSTKPKMKRVRQMDYDPNAPETEEDGIRAEAMRRLRVRRAFKEQGTQTERSNWPPNPPNSDICRQMYEMVSADSECEVAVGDWKCKWIGILVHPEPSWVGPSVIDGSTSDNSLSGTGCEIDTGTSVTVETSHAPNTVLVTETQIYFGKAVIQYTTQTKQQPAVHYVQFFGDHGTPLGWRGPWIGREPQSASYLSVGELLVCEGFCVDHLGRQMQIEVD